MMKIIRVLILVSSLILLASTVTATWWNSSYDSRMLINCTNMDNGVPLVINGSDGFDIDGDNQIVWTYCAGENTSLYYNTGDSSSYVVANDTRALPFEVEDGNGASHNPTDVWTDYKLVYHFNNSYADSTTNSNDGTANGVSIEASCGGVGSCMLSNANSDYLDYPAGMVTATGDWTLQAFMYSDDNTQSNKRYFVMRDDLRLNIGPGISTAGAIDTWANGAYPVLVNDYPELEMFMFHLTYDESATEFLSYFNGVLNHTNSHNTAADAGNNNWIGHNTVANLGKYDEFRIIREEISASQSAQEYQNWISTEGYGTLGANESNLNTSPTSVPRIDPTTANIHSDLLGYCNGTDADGDNITYFYEWFRDNVTMYSGSFTNNTAGNPVPVGTIFDSVPPGSLDEVFGLFVSGDYAYTVAQEDDSFAVWDISGHGNPVPVGSVTDSDGANSLDKARDVFVSGDYAYTVSYTDDTLAVWDISGHGNPVPVGTYTDSEGANSLAGVNSVFVSGDYAYTVSSLGDTLSVWDISAHGNPVPVGSVTDSEGDYSLDNAKTVFVSGDYAYTTSATDDTFAVWDISGHGNPIPVGTYFDNETDYSIDVATGLFVSGDFAYVCSYADDTLTVFNISGHGNPFPIGFVTDSGGDNSLNGVFSVYVSGDYAYTGTYNDGTLSVWDISAHGNPVPVGSYTDMDGDYSLDRLIKIKVQGDYAYTISENDKILAVWDIGNGFLESTEQLVNTLPSSYTESQDEWTFSCQAYDGEDYSSWSNTSITINDTCVYIGSGDWDININDNCTLNTNTDVGANKIKFYGDVGHTLITAIIFAKDIEFEPDDFDGDTMIGVESGGILAAQP